MHLKSGYVVLIDDEELHKTEGYGWSPSFDSNNGSKKLPYIVAHSSRKNYAKDHTIRLHRLIMNAQKGQIVDHINGNPLDNRKVNLRFATPAQNNANSIKSKLTKNKYKGAYFAKGKNGKQWRSIITVGRKRIHLGYFCTPEEANAAYLEAAVQHYGEFANASSSYTGEKN
jgi:hypothetical protein